MMILTMSMVADPCAQVLVKVSRGKHVRLRPLRLRHPKNVEATAQANWKNSMTRRNFAHLKPLGCVFRPLAVLENVKSKQIKHAVGVLAPLRHLIPLSSRSMVVGACAAPLKSLWIIIESQLYSFLCACHCPFPYQSLVRTHVPSKNLSQLWIFTRP